MEYSNRLHASVRLLLCLSAGVRVLAAAADVPAVRRGCQPRCGDVDIPYPFGIGDECAIHDDFDIDCRDVNGTKRPFIGAFEVKKISVPDAKAWMKLNISWQCYDPPTRTMEGTIFWQSFTDSSYRLSNVDNKIFVIGCNTLAYMRSASYVLGCVSKCNSKLRPQNGTCSGAGCCEVDVPKDMGYFESYFNENYNTTRIWNYSRCSYVVVMEKAAFHYSTTYIASTTFRDAHNGTVPAVMDWVIRRDSTCKHAANNKTSYECVSGNSHCVDSTNGRGYRCKCSNGYDGNPYMTDGCKDIDECRDNSTYPCPGTCENTPGSYTCSCPQGQHKVDHGVCIPDQKIQRSSSWVMPVVGASVGLVVLVVTISCAHLIQERRKLQHIKQKYFRQHGGLLLFEEMKSQQGVAFQIFSEEELREATDKFNEKQVLGHGGHGTVYKGLLKDNVEVAVKVCRTIDEQQKKEFGREMLILSQINHKNIVKLLGCCLEVEVPILVYEFIPNGTLFHLIHGNHGRHITLATRLQIAHESAEALAYLHSWASPPILHGDIKSSNILVDGNYTAKVSDFGASVLAPTDESQFMTLVQGTCGYLDPEYMQTCQLTDKSDVYSFGVVLLELLTRKKAFNLEGPEHEKSLSMRFLSAMKENKLEDILDDQIKSNENMEFLEEIAGLARQCLEMSGANRPSMKEVAEKLDRLRKVMQHPWAQQNTEELESLLGESSMVSSGVVTTGTFSIDKEAVMELGSGR